jgi:hypothetical protein
MLALIVVGLHPEFIIGLSLKDLFRPCSFAASRRRGPSGHRRRSLPDATARLHGRPLSAFRARTP